MKIYFEAELARKTTVSTAILLAVIKDEMLTAKRQRKTKTSNGRVWINFSTKRLLRLCPFWEKSNCARLLAKLCSDGYLHKECFDDNPFSTELWYAFTDKAMKLMADTNDYDLSALK